MCEGPAPAPPPEEKELPPCGSDGICVAQGFFTGDVNPASVLKAVNFIVQANRRGVKAIVLEINSDGGSVDAGFLLAKAIESSPAPVTCVVDGEAMSMAFYILQSCTTRVMTFRSSLMTHEVRLVSVGGVHETERVLLNDLDLVRASSRGFAEHVSRRMGMPYQEYDRHVRGGRDWYMNHEQALKFHAVDRVVSTVTEAMALLADDLAGKVSL